MTTTATPAIALRGVSKRYRFFALDDVSLRLEPGQILGFVGPNGAGKSTTIRILMALVRPDAGDVEVLGCRMPGEQVRAKWDVGFVSEEMRLFPGATIGWHVGFVRSLFPGAWDDRYAARLLQRFHLHPEQRVKGLSHGEQVKAALLLALARRPRLLVLDEPTVGLDPILRESLWALFHRLAQDGATLLVSSHVMDEAARCDRLLLMREGEIIGTPTPDQLLAEAGCQDMEAAFLSVIKSLEGRAEH